MVKDLQMLYQMNAEIFGRANKVGHTASTPSSWDNETVEGDEAQMAEFEVFSQPDNKMLAMECILHSADVSNPCRAWEVTRGWAFQMLEEFFAQGDQEKMLGIPVQALNDRDKVNP